MAIVARMLQRLGWTPRGPSDWLDHNGHEVPLWDSESLRELVAAKDLGLATRVDAQLEECLRLAEALDPHFDGELSSDNPEGNARVMALADALLELESLFYQATWALNLWVDGGW